LLGKTLNVLLLRKTSNLLLLGETPNLLLPGETPSLHFLGKTSVAKLITLIPIPLLTLQSDLVGPQLCFYIDSDNEFAGNIVIRSPEQYNGSDYEDCGFSDDPDITEFPNEESFLSPGDERFGPVEEQSHIGRGNVVGSEGDEPEVTEGQYPATQAAPHTRDNLFHDEGTTIYSHLIFRELEEKQNLRMQ
jgi:hypothetical protein